MLHSLCPNSSCIAAVTLHIGLPTWEMGVAWLRALSELSVWHIGWCRLVVAPVPARLDLSVCLCPESGRALGTAARLWSGYGGLWLFGPPEWSELHSEVSSWLSHDRAHILGEACLIPASGSPFGPGEGAVC